MMSHTFSNNLCTTNTKYNRQQIANLDESVLHQDSFILIMIWVNYLFCDYKRVLNNLSHSLHHLLNWFDDENISITVEKIKENGDC
jgi:hypothetical protein